MRVPASSPQHQTNNQQRPVSSNNDDDNNNNNNSNSGRSVGFHVNTARNLCYEPTSVLDLRRSPSPVAGKPVPVTDHVDWDDAVLPNLDWDSIMGELDLHEDSAPALKGFANQLFNPCDNQIQNNNLHEFATDAIQFAHSDFNDLCLNSLPTYNFTSLDLSHSVHNWNHGFDFIQELIRAADCFDSNDLQLAHAILERLNQRLHSPTGRPLQRAAFFFKEALQSILTGSTHPPTRFSSWSEIVQTVRAYKVFSSISPIPMFTHLTTNQAILDTLDGSLPFIHVIDFDIGFGCQYASLMRELVEKADARKLTSPVLRITAVVTEDYAIETKLIKESLSQFAQGLRVEFQIEFVLVRTFEMLSFKAIKFMEGEKTAVLLSPTMFPRLGSMNTITAFAADLLSVSPSIVVFVDSEGWAECGPTSFRRNFVNGLKFYSIIFDSLDASASGGDWVRKIEMLWFKSRILAALEGCGRRVVPPWREVLCGAGFRPVQLSQFADFQAECLVEKVQARGFHVAKRQADLVLCWNERPVIATSAWKC